MLRKIEQLVLTREQLEAWAGRALSDEEMERLDSAIPNSSIPDAVAEIAASFVGELHKDLSQHYEGGFFWTRCSCGVEFPGTDPDEADYFQSAHQVNEVESIEQLTNDPKLPAPRPWEA